jgi:hypothetical protein
MLRVGEIVPGLALALAGQIQPLVSNQERKANMGQQIKSALLQSTHRVLEVLVNFLPGVLALLLAMILFTLIGWGLSALAYRILIAMRFDDRLAERATSDAPAGIADWSPARSPALLVSRAILWLCILIGLALGVSAFDASYSAQSQMSSFLLPYLTHIAGAVLLFIGGTLLARFLARSVLIGAVNAQLHYARFLSLGVKWLVLVLTAAMVLEHLHVGGTVVGVAFGILFGGIVLTLSLAIGLGSRDLVTRSIEKTMERPNAANATQVVPPSTADDTGQSRLRHF